MCCRAVGRYYQGKRRMLRLFFFFSESPKDFKNIEVSEENVRLDARPESTIGPSSCSSSPTNSPARHSQHYRTLQSYSSPTRKLNIAVTPNHQRDVDQVHSKRWHTAPKEKHKVHISYIVCVQFDGAFDWLRRARAKEKYITLRNWKSNLPLLQTSYFFDIKVQFTLIPLSCYEKFENDNKIGKNITIMNSSKNITQLLGTSTCRQLEHRTQHEQTVQVQGNRANQYTTSVPTNDRETWLEDYRRGMIFFTKTYM